MHSHFPAFLPPPLLPRHRHPSHPRPSLCPRSPSRPPPLIHPLPPRAAALPPRLTAVLSLPTTALPPALAASLAAAAAAAAPFTILFVLLSAATAGLLSQRYSWGQALSAPVVTTLLTLFLTNATPLPSAHPLYVAVTKLLVPLAVPLLLFSADLRRVLRDTRRLVSVFALGAAATVLATLAAYRLVPLAPVLGPRDAWKIAAALCARHIGGAVNYVAVVEATAAAPEAVTAALAADNLVTALYFVLLLLLARGVPQPPAAALPAAAPVSTVAAPVSAVAAPPPGLAEDLSPSTAVIGMQDAAVALSISAAMCAVATAVDALLPFPLGPIPVVTAVALFLVTSFPRFFDRYRIAASAVGLFFMQVFFAATGAGGSVMAVLAKAPLLLLFSTVQLAIHLVIFLSAGKMLRFHKSEILISSNANVGGPSTAAGMASAMKWDRLVIPAILVGVFGYSIATFVSLALGHLVLKPS